MTNQDVEKWLMQEAKNKNSLAETYLSLLKDATPEMRRHWMEFLGSLLSPVMQGKDEIKRALEGEK